MRVIKFSVDAYLRVFLHNDDITSHYNYFVRRNYRFIITDRIIIQLADVNMAFLKTRVNPFPPPSEEVFFTIQRPAFRFLKEVMFIS